MATRVVGSRYGEQRFRWRSVVGVLRKKVCGLRRESIALCHGRFAGDKKLKVFRNLDRQFPDIFL